MIKFKDFEFKKINDYTWKYDIYASVRTSASFSVKIYNWGEYFYVQIDIRGMSDWLPKKHQFSTYEEAETAARLFIEKMLLQHVEIPKPPTCASCKYLKKGVGGYSCHRIDIDNKEQQGALSSWEGIEIVLIDNFGCIHHSDYERK